MLRRATALQPDYVRAWFEIGAALQDQEPDQAIACYRGVLARAPQPVDALYNSAFLLQGRGDFPAAARFEACLASAPERAGAWLALGFCRSAAMLPRRSQPIERHSSATPCSIRRC